MELKSKQSDVSLSPSVSEQLPQLVILELNFIIYNDTLKEAEYYNFQKRSLFRATLNLYNIWSRVFSWHCWISVVRCQKSIDKRTNLIAMHLHQLIIIWNPSTWDQHALEEGNFWGSCFNIAFFCFNRKLRLRFLISAKDCLLTGRKQACTRITWLVVR